MISPVQDLFYNIIHYALTQLHEVSPLNYSATSCSFSIHDPINCKSEDTIKDIKKILNEISNIAYLYDLSDPKCVFVDQTPLLENGVFKYNPISEIPAYSEELMAQLKQKINTLGASKKSRSLKYLSNI